MGWGCIADQTVRPTHSPHLRAKAERPNFAAFKLNPLALRPKLKISNLISLQDARSSAAVGFDMISFNLVRGAHQKVSVSMAWNIIQWLSGPDIVLELTQASLPEREEAAQTFSFGLVSLPLTEWTPQLPLGEEGLILRADASADPEEVARFLSAAQAQGREVWIELHLPQGEDLARYAAVRERCLLHLPSLDLVERFIQSGAEMPGGFAFYDEAEEEPGVLDYERIDDFLEVFNEVFDEED